MRFLGDIRAINVRAATLMARDTSDRAEETRECRNERRRRRSSGRCLRVSANALFSSKQRALTALFIFRISFTLFLFANERKR